MTKKVVIFDLDGTICNVTHRRKFVASKPKNWDAWNKGISLDTPNEAVKFMFESIVSRDDVEVLFVSVCLCVCYGTMPSRRRRPNQQSPWQTLRCLPSPRR